MRAVRVFAAVAVAAVLIGPTVGSAMASRPTQAATDFASIDAHVRADMQASSVPGLSYAIARDGEVVHAAAFGVGSDGRDVTTATPFVIGSVGKTITALAIRQLIAAGRVEIDAPVQRYLPWFTLADPSAGGKITIQMLLTHTSGLSMATGQDSTWYQPGLTPAHAVRGLAGVVPDRVPGSSVEYSNLNYVILGVVIEAVSGQPYTDYLRDHVFGPLGMSRSAATWDDAVAGGLVAGHRYLFGLAVPYVEPYPTAIVPAGYQVSTAGDMARYVAAFSNHGRYGAVDVVAAEGAAGEPDYGIDWEPLGAYSPGLAPGHSGATLNYNAGLIYMPAQRLGVIVLANSNPTELNVTRGAYEIAFDVLRLSIGQEPLPSPPTVVTAYLVVDLGLGILVALTAIHAIRLRTWRRRFAASRHPSRILGRSVVADGLVPLAVIVGLPILLGMTRTVPPFDPIAGWRLLTWTLPDVAFSLLGVSGALIVVGATKVAWLLAERAPSVAVAPAA